MQIKEVQPLNFLYFRTETKVQELGRYVGVVARELLKDAVLNDLEVSGPIYWNYFGFNGDEDKPFGLEISLPVTEIPKSYRGKYRLKRTEAYSCVSLVHEGSWYNIPQSYSKLLTFIQENNLKPVGENREIYINMDFINPSANITEIQLGVESIQAYRNRDVIKSSVSDDVEADHASTLS